MPILGTIVNGEAKFDQPCTLPDGFRFELIGEDEEDFGPTPVLPAETYEEYLEGLREAIAETDRGMRGQSSKEVFEEISNELHLRRIRKG
jgi:hypothetical protein